MALAILAGNGHSAPLPAQQEARRRLNVVHCRPAAPATDFASGAAHAPLRLTRRGKLVLIILPVFAAALAVLVAWSALMAPAKAGVEAVGPGAVETVTVQPGQSLWSIAEGRVPDQDPRVTISQIRQLNDLTSTRVVPGEQIVVPLAR
ncbi:LysM peptidoglycan-binding domain-containing protein [Sinomonas atrocyanea]|uniref:LysM peptidoglycan-binding domain-containing protein n=1 Tax=Sinomonas atrocyanea TaxID=37927 RepID=UPI003D95732D